MAQNTRTLNPFAPPFNPTNPRSRNANHSVLTPVPRGPRFSRSSPPQRRREPEPKPTSNNSNVVRGFVRRSRWKNKRGHFAQLLPMDAETTSVMIRNIPNKYTMELLIQALDNHCKVVNETQSDQFYSAYDFLYLPIDFKSGKSAGFVFVNFTNPKAALRFKEAFDGKHWLLFECPKLAEISKAKIQGTSAIINYYKRMEFTGGLDEDLPALFEPARDGSGRVESKRITLGKNYRLF